MFTILLLTTIACACAAPHYDYHHDHQVDYPHEPRYPRHEGLDLEEIIHGKKFDTNFWKNLSFEMSNSSIRLGDLHKHIPGGILEEKIEGDVYKVSFWLPRCENNTMVVKAMQGLLLIRAYEDASEKSDLKISYLNERVLPLYVDENGTWSYRDGVLTITFPLVQNKLQEYDIIRLARRDDAIVPTGTAQGLKDIVEATTYAVDLKYEVISEK